jgi:hypothetical protein
MYTRLDRAHRVLPVTLGVITLAGVGVLLVCDVAPAIFPPRAHDWLGAFPLAMIADWDGSRLLKEFRSS